MRGVDVLLVFVFLATVMLVSEAEGHPFFVALQRLQDEGLMSKRALDKCGCNLGCFYSSARDCMSCCALAL